MSHLLRRFTAQLRRCLLDDSVDLRRARRTPFSPRLPLELELTITPSDVKPESFACKRRPYANSEREMLRRSSLLKEETLNAHPT
jgi:hypothetical protein